MLKCDILACISRFFCVILHFNKVKTIMEQYTVKPDVLGYDDIVKLVPAFEGKRKLVEVIGNFLALDKVNDLHSRFCDTPGPQFVNRMLDDLNSKLEINNEQVLDNMPNGKFVTVSNHPFGALDGIILIKMLTDRYPEFKVRVNMILNYISAMRPNFIAVDALQSNDPKQQAVSRNGLREAINQIQSGNPLGFFPAGAVSKITRHLRIEDRDWQPTIMRLIQKFNVPVVPIYFHGHNSFLFNFLGLISWQLRTLRLPSEVFASHDRTFRISIGDPIMPEELAKHADVEELGKFLKEKTYSMRFWKK